MVALAVNADTHETETGYGEWRHAFAQTWEQGEHVTLLGPTGSGKTHTAADIVSIQEYVLALAVKRQDDVLSQFTHKTPRYTRIKEWPPPYHVKRALMVLPPKSLADRAQAYRVYDAINSAFLEGGWCIFLDDTGYITGTLRLKGPLTVLLNQGRSLGITVVCASTQASSVHASMPSEVLRQIRHVLMWRFEALADIEACARITGLEKKRLLAAMQSLRVFPDGSTDFLAYHRGSGLVVVRQER